MSIDSAASNMLALRVGRQGVGDKMFESTAMDHDYGMPFTAIYASPPASDAGDSLSMSSYEGVSAYPYPYDSVINAIDMEQEQYTGVSDSIFEKTGFKTTMAVEDSIFKRTEYQSMSVEDDSVFDGVEEDSYMPSIRPFRPVSISSTGSIHHAPRDDDTLISVCISHFTYLAHTDILLR
jgi:serine/arginine repetitive matrix protein 2